MRSELEHIARIEQYLEGKLSLDEKKLFEAEMESDETLREAVAFQSLVQKRIERLALIDIIQKEHQNFTQKGQHFFRFNLNSLWWLIGGVILCMVIYTIFRPTDELVKTFVSEPDTAENVVAPKQPPRQTVLIDSAIETPTEPRHYMIRLKRPESVSMGSRLLIEMTAEGMQDNVQDDAKRFSLQNFVVPYDRVIFRSDKGFEGKMLSGTHLKVPQNVFVDEKGMLYNGNVTLLYREFKEVSDMLLLDIDSPSELCATNQIFEIELIGEEDQPIRLIQPVEVQIAQGNQNAAFSFLSSGLSFSSDPSTGINTSNEGYIRTYQINRLSDDVIELLVRHSCDDKEERYYVFGSRKSRRNWRKRLEEYDRSSLYLYDTSSNFRGWSIWSVVDDGQTMWRGKAGHWQFHKNGYCYHDSVFSDCFNTDGGSSDFIELDYGAKEDLDITNFFSDSADSFNKSFAMAAQKGFSDSLIRCFDAGFYQSYDRCNEVDSIRIIPTFVDPEGHELVSGKYKMVLVEPESNRIYRIGSAGFDVIPTSQYQILLYTENELLALHKPWPELNISQSGSYTFTVEDITDFVYNKTSLRNYLKD